MNDPLFYREALHEYTKGPEKQNKRRLKQMKNCFVKADKKKDVCDSSGLKSSLKVSSVMITMTWMTANFIMSFQLRIEAVF